MREEMKLKHSFLGQSIGTQDLVFCIFFKRTALGWFEKINKERVVVLLVRLQEMCCDSNIFLAGHCRCPFGRPELIKHQPRGPTLGSHTPWSQRASSQQ